MLTDAAAYEDVCRKKMRELDARATWPFHFARVGRFWDGDTEIDVAALDPEGKNPIPGECRYRQTPVGLNVLCELARKIGAVLREKARRRVWYVLFSTGGFTQELRKTAALREDALLVDGSDGRSGEN